MMDGSVHNACRQRGYPSMHYQRSGLTQDWKVRPTPGLSCILPLAKNRSIFGVKFLTLILEDCLAQTVSEPHVSIYYHLPRSQGMRFHCTRLQTCSLLESHWGNYSNRCLQCNDRKWIQTITQWSAWMREQHVRKYQHNRSWNRWSPCQASRTITFCEEWDALGHGHLLVHHHSPALLLW
jgi:hypothetical protein